MEQTKVKGVAESYPGALTMEMVSTMRSLQVQGKRWRSNRTSVLQDCAGQACNWAAVPGSPQHISGPRPPSSREGRVCSRRTLPEVEGTRGRLPRDLLVAMRMEVPPPEMGSLAGRTRLAVQKEDYQLQGRWQVQGEGCQERQDNWRRDDARPESKDKKGKGGEKKG